MNDSEWISRAAATNWLVRDYGLSVGRAEAEVRAAIRSDCVRLDALFFGKRERVSAEILGRLGFFCTDVCLNFADLVPQIRQQLKEVEGPIRSKVQGVIARRLQKPAQETVNDWVLRWAQQQEGRKVKQDDRDLIRECANATGARDKQFIEACHNLPERYRYTVGAQAKSCK